LSIVGVGEKKGTGQREDLVGKESAVQFSGRGVKRPAPRKGPLK